MYVQLEKFKGNEINQQAIKLNRSSSRIATNQKKAREHSEGIVQEKTCHQFGLWLGLNLKLIWYVSELWEGLAWYIRKDLLSE